MGNTETQHNDKGNSGIRYGIYTVCCGYYATAIGPSKNFYNANAYESDHGYFCNTLTCNDSFS